MKTSTAVSTSILAFVAFIQVCPAPPVVLGPIIIAADGAIGGSAIAAGINHHRKRADEMPHTKQNERCKSGCCKWPVSPPSMSSASETGFSDQELTDALQACE